MKNWILYFCSVTGVTHWPVFSSHVEPVGHLTPVHLLVPLGPGGGGGVGMHMPLS